MAQLNKSDLNKVIKIWKEQLSQFNDLDVEEFISELSDKANDYDEKGNEEKAEAYAEMVEKLEAITQSIQELYSDLEEHLD